MAHGNSHQTTLSKSEHIRWRGGDLIRGHGHLSMFGPSEEFMPPFVMDHTRGITPAFR